MRCEHRKKNNLSKWIYWHPEGQNEHVVIRSREMEFVDESRKFIEEMKRRKAQQTHLLQIQQLQQIQQSQKHQTQLSDTKLFGTLPPTNMPIEVDAALEQQPFNWRSYGSCDCGNK